MRGGLLSRLFDGDGLGEVARLIHVAAAADGDVVGEQLQRNDFENGRDQFRRRGDFDDVIGSASRASWSPSVTTAMTMPSRAFTS